MYPWSIDAREAIKDISDIDDDLIEKTDDIKVFLHQDRYYFVIASKGLGKSLLLLSKRKNLKGIECLPKDILLDTPEVIIDTLSRDVLSLLYDEEAMSHIWSISLILAIIKNSGNFEDILKKDISESLRYLLRKEIITASSHFGEILRSISRRQFFHDLIYDYNTLTSTAQTLNRTVAIFIDNVDECFEKSDRRIWYIAQTSLIRAIYKLNRLNPKFKIFASIRKEAFLKLKHGTEMFLQYEGVSLDILYHKEELKGIFIKNIKKEEENKYVKKELKKENPIVAFMGVDKILHGHVNEAEDIFDYIYRHTLKRPRDFMEMGRAISKIPISERDPKTSNGIDKIKSIINETATEIATSYINEIAPHLKFKDFNRIFELINSNVLEKDKVKLKCMEFNGKNYECLDADCKKCKKTHIFCELYKIGLLGYVAENPTTQGEYIQKFTTVGEKTFDDVGLLPDSIYYLIHPILDGLIRQKSNKYKDGISPINIIGYQRSFKMVSPKIMIPLTNTKEIKSPRKEIEPPFKIDATTPRLISKNKKTIPFKGPWYAVLKALVTPVGRTPIGVLTDDFIAKIILKVEGKSDDIEHDSKKMAEEFARGIRRYLKKKYNITDRDAIIKRVKGGFIPGNLWDEKPVIYGSQVPSFSTNKEPYKTDDWRVRKKQPNEKRWINEEDPE